MFQRATVIDRTGRIARASTIAVIASPVRQDILDTIEMLGGSASVGELAEQLGRPADGLYYHVDVLRRAGLLVAADDRRAGRGERRYHVPVARGRRLSIDYRGDRKHARAVAELAQGMLRIAHRDFTAALAQPGTVLAGDRRELWASRTAGWVDERELARLNRLLAEVIACLRHPRSARRTKLASVCFVLAPLASRPKRRAHRAGRFRSARRRS